MGTERINEIEALKDAGRYDQAIRAIHESISEAADDSERSLYLMNLVVCATNARNESMARDAIEELFKLRLLPEEEPFRNCVAGTSFLSFAEPQKSVHLLRLNLDNPILLGDDFREQRYESLAQYGFALCHLGRYSEAMDSLDKAEDLCPAGNLRTDMQLYRITCLVRLKRLEDAAQLARQVAENESGSIGTKARYDLASIRCEQKLFLDALGLFREVESLLPCEGITETDVRLGIAEALGGLTAEQQHLQ